MNKEQERILKKYNDSDMIQFWQAYDSPSHSKIEAWVNCKNLMNDLKGWGLKVISKNTFMFTVGFQFEEDGKNKLMYITPSKKIAFEI